MPEDRRQYPSDRRAVSRRAALFTGAAVAGGVLFGGAAQAVAAPSAAAAAAAPTVRTRAAWNARPPTSPAQVLNQAPTYIVVHHTATGNSTDYSLAAAYALSRSIQNYHMDSNGWADTGQQLTISRGGHIMEGRNSSLSAINNGRHVVGAHVANYNSRAVGIENQGTYTSATPTTALYNALVETCAWLCSAYGRPTSAIIGHRDLNATACPGDRLYAMLPQLRRDVGARLSAMGNGRLAGAGLAAGEMPPFPEVPASEPEGRFRHGPALGSRDSNASAG
ncbi:peptidoglycan recognition family protein [Nocardiopsis sp. RSe5-2]|uniref:Peptidoglycan recognition family protein n=1 Tax=Nocardiopsis endophytica TaxID=3018445 RepID=A0ABT4U6Z8_9ACTN|nr:peptidoglycan recognition family protein [Nocardiopsis endophytica]MDA2812729.1 peptidoglycan recognition family protein [Nocardiopsis endophytica]